MSRSSSSVVHIRSFYDHFDALADPNRDRHEELKDWIGSDFDPHAFSVDEVNRKLAPRHRRSCLAQRLMIEGITEPAYSAR